MLKRGLGSCPKSRATVRGDPELVRATFVESFFCRTEERAIHFGTLDPLEFPEQWVAPDERCRRKYPDD